MKLDFSSCKKCKNSFVLNCRSCANPGLAKSQQGLLPTSNRSLGLWALRVLAAAQLSWHVRLLRLIVIVFELLADDQESRNSSSFYAPGRDPKHSRRRDGINGPSFPPLGWVFDFHRRNVTFLPAGAHALHDGLRDLEKLPGRVVFRNEMSRQQLRPVRGFGKWPLRNAECA
jgi:hypothetical protein